VSRLSRQCRSLTSHNPIGSHDLSRGLLIILTLRISQRIEPATFRRAGIWRVDYSGFSLAFVGNPVPLLTRLHDTMLIIQFDNTGCEDGVMSWGAQLLCYTELSLNWEKCCEALEIILFSVPPQSLQGKASSKHVRGSLLSNDSRFTLLRQRIQLHGLSPRTKYTYRASAACRLR
jgi:hypothetical protein